jgi:hypothetical protein
MPDSSTASWGTNHVHTNRCYWDLTICGWVCPPANAPDEPVATVVDYDEAATGSSLSAVEA